MEDWKKQYKYQQSFPRSALNSSSLPVMHSQSTQAKHCPQRSLSQSSTTTTSSRTSQRSLRKKHGCFRISGDMSGSPMPIEIPKSHNRHSSSSSQYRDLPRSAPKHFYFDQNQRSTSPDQMSPDASSPRSPQPESFKRASTPTRRHSDDYRRYTGTVNHCGRHSNDWLFGGFSVRDTIRDSFGKLRHADKES